MGNLTPERPSFPGSDREVWREVGLRIDQQDRERADWAALGVKGPESLNKGWDELYAQVRAEVDERNGRQVRSEPKREQAATYVERVPERSIDCGRER